MAPLAAPNPCFFCIPSSFVVGVRCVGRGRLPVATIKYFHHPFRSIVNVVVVVVESPQNPWLPGQALTLELVARLRPSIYALSRAVLSLLFSPCLGININSSGIIIKIDKSFDSLPPGGAAGLTSLSAYSVVPRSTKEGGHSGRLAITLLYIFILFIRRRLDRIGLDSELNSELFTRFRIRSVSDASDVGLRFWSEIKLGPLVRCWVCLLPPCHFMALYTAITLPLLLAAVHQSKLRIYHRTRNQFSIFMEFTKRPHPIYYFYLQQRYGTVFFMDTKPTDRQCYWSMVRACSTWWWWPSGNRKPRICNTTTATAQFSEITNPLLPATWLWRTQLHQSSHLLFNVIKQNDLNWMIKGIKWKIVYF